jgi:tRNA nucleotidyltransferase (CCA-adding enzyme)
VLRHVSAAFAEDPVRILRVARFAARFGFPVAPQTMKLMKGMVASGETDHLVPERVWQEFAKGLAERHPERMFEVLEKCGLRKKLTPELQEWKRKVAGPVCVRFAALCWDLGKSQVEALCKRLRAPNEVRDLAMLAADNRDRMTNARTPAQLLELLKRADAFRRPERFAQLTQAAAPMIDTARLRNALQAAAAVDAGAIAAAAGSPAEIPKLLDKARIAAIGGK